MASFAPFVTILAEIEDPRRAEGKLYRLPHVLLFAILAIVAGANSYRTIHSFIDVHLAGLRDAFGLKWRRAPAYTTIRGILRQLDAASVEAAFRRHAAALNNAARIEGQRHVAIDGKTLRNSFDNFLDRRAAHMLSAFAADTALCWRISIATISPTRYRPYRPCWHAWPGWCRGHGRRHALSKKAFEQAAADGVHLIAQVKANQPTLHHAVAALCETAAPLDRALSADKKRRCRDEASLVEVFSPDDSLADTEWADHVHAIIRATRDVLTRSAATGLWRATNETALFVSNVVLPAAVCADTIRDHWSIENRSHCVHG